MATFIMLSRLSPEGMKTLKGNPERLQEVNREVEGFGARVVQQYALLGEYDFITVLEAPDPETVSRVSVELSSRATARYETLTAISVEEFVSRIRGEGSRDAEALQQQAAARRGDDHPSTEEPARREEIRREEAPPPSGREERAGQQQERGREEERSLLERARDAVTGGEQEEEEEEPRREEEPGRREAPRGPREDEPPPPPPWR
jgi:uncharacterized protein with GYD domain